MSMTPLDWDAFDEVTALQAAQRGDMDGLARKVRSGSPLTIPERAFIADFLAGRAEIDASANQRQETLDTHILNGLFVLRVQAARGGPLAAAYHETCAFLGVSRRSLQTAVKHARNDPLAVKRLRRFKDILDEDERAGRMRKWSLLELALHI